jgi:hypothetical protein
MRSRSRPAIAECVRVARKGSHVIICALHLPRPPAAAGDYQEMLVEETYEPTAGDANTRCGDLQSTNHTESWTLSSRSSPIGRELELPHRPPQRNQLTDGGSGSRPSCRIIPTSSRFAKCSAILPSAPDTCGCAELRKCDPWGSHPRAFRHRPESVRYPDGCRCMYIGQRPTRPPRQS